MSFAPFLLSFGLNAASGILGNIGQRQSAEAERRQRNRSLLSNYNYQLQRYSFDVQQRNRIYAARVNQYQQQVQFNNRALQQAYEGEQRRLNDLFDTTAVKNQQSFINYSQQAGKFLASGRSGKTVERLENAQRAALGRVQAIRQASLKRGIGNAKFNNRRFRLQAEAANQRAYADVAVAPMFAPPPQQPTLFQGQSNTAFGLGLGQSVLGAAAGSFNLLPDSFFGN